jgi:hypothetical protein
MAVINGLSDTLARQFGVSDDAENPLEVIGFTDAILNLGLSDEELYDYAYRTARWLVAHFHSDRSGQVADLNEKQERIKHAYDELKTDKSFKRWLGKFRTKKSEESSDQNELKRTLSASQKNFQRVQEQIKEVQTHSNNMMRMLHSTQDRLTERIYTDGLFFSKPVVYRHRVLGGGRYYAVGREQATAMIVMSIHVQNALKSPNNHLLAEFRAEYRRKIKAIEAQRANKMQSTEMLGPLRDDMLSQGFGATSFKGLLEETLANKSLLPPLVWNPRKAFHRLNFARLAKFDRIDSLPDPYKTLSHLSPEGLQALDSSYRKALQVVGEMIARRRINMVNEARIVVERIPLERGYFKYGRLLHRIIGSSLPFDLESTGGYHISGSTMRLFDKAVTTTTRPLILLNSLLVSSPVESIKLQGSNERDTATYLINNLQKVKRQFHASHFILELECDGDTEQEEEE